MRNIISISLSGLENIGLRKILESLPSIKLECIDSNSLMEVEVDKYALFIARSETVVRYLNFFLPLKDKVLVLISGEVLTDSVFRCVYSDTAPEEIVKPIAEILENNSKQKGSNKLSSREIEVLSELSSGKTQKEIADKLCISLATVISHRKNISAKLGIRSISGLALYASLNGYIK